MLLLTASLCGCGKIEVTIITPETEETEQSGFKPFAAMNTPKKNFRPMQGMNIGDGDIAELIQSVQDLVQSESDLWYIEEITDDELLKELTIKNQNGNNQNWKEAIDKESIMPEKDSDDGFAPKGNGKFTPNTMPGNGRFTGKGRIFGGRHSFGNVKNMRYGNVGNRLGGHILMISGKDGSRISADDLWTMIQEDAEVMGINVHNVELTDEQIQLINTKTGYVPSLIVRIGVKMPAQATGDATE